MVAGGGAAELGRIDGVPDEAFRNLFDESWNEVREDMHGPIHRRAQQRSRAGYNRKITRQIRDYPDMKNRNLGIQADREIDMRNRASGLKMRVDRCVRQFLFDRRRDLRPHKLLDPGPIDEQPPILAGKELSLWRPDGVETNRDHTVDQYDISIAD